MNTKIVCKLCRSDKNEVFQKFGDYTYYTCKRCEAIYSVKSISADDAAATYLDDPLNYLKTVNPEGQFWMLDAFERMYFNTSKGHERGKLLEIGAGVGYWDLMALARGWEVNGIETSKKSAKFARDVFKIPVENCYLQDYSPIEKFDAVAMIEVIEHIDDPLWVIQKLKTLAPKGVFFATTPNTKSSHWLLTLDPELPEHWSRNIYFPDDHVFLFCEKTIKVLARKGKLKKLRVEFFGMGENHDSNIMFSARL